ncbi:ABC transporter ATP-binding protein [Clostridium neuense]|uniref:ABC transporter ATP-binding protein n=1 Tax=Clostridium neuense TaxID=1728934 RepID=A0ABW8TK16_9CLOT
MSEQNFKDSSSKRGTMDRRVKKPKSFMETMGKLAGYCKKYIPAILIAWIAATAGTVLQIIGPDKLKDLTNEIMKGLPAMIKGNQVIGSINMNVISKIAWTLAVLYGISMLLNYLQNMIMAKVTQVISKKMRTDISQKINRLPLKYFDSTSIGDVLSRVTNDVDAIGESLNQSIGTLITSVTMLIGSLVLMVYSNWILALTAVGASAFGIVFMQIIMKGSQKYFMEQQEALGRINGHIEEVYTGHNVVKVYNGSSEAKEIFEKYNTNLYGSAWKSQFLSGLMMPLMSFMGNFSYAAVCGVGAALAMDGKITFGVIVAFMMYAKLFTQPLSQMAMAMTTLQRTAAASERVFEFLDEAELKNESEKQSKLAKVKGNVEFKNVKFGYTPDKTIINNFSVDIKAGQKVAIVGPTGAGKTTIVNLLMRFYELNSGEICIDGVPIHKVPRENVHEQFSMVLQDTWIFEGTIKENIIYNKQGVTEAEVIKACKSVGLHHFIKTLPNGYDTMLNDKTSLSEGQKQLITIARAMIQNAPLLILDEATSSVDTRMERIVQAAMDRLTVGKTSFVIAHRLSTIKNADIILVMKDGDIIESGSHEELLAREGFYAELYNNQFEAA